MIMARQSTHVYLYAKETKNPIAVQSQTGSSSSINITPRAWTNVGFSFVCYENILV